MKGRGPSSPALASVRVSQNHVDHPSNPEIERIIAAIETMDLDQLRAEWTKRLGGSAPRCRSKEVIRGLLAWRIQADAYVGMLPDTARRLRQLAERFKQPHTAVAAHPSNRDVRTMTASTLKRGTVLTREWRGSLHRVQVLDNGFAHAGRVYRSLSEIARTITGTHWSGPRFFGLTGGRVIAATSVRPTS
jgi:hypothetical protein